MFMMSLNLGRCYRYNIQFTCSQMKSEPHSGKQTSLRLWGNVVGRIDPSIVVSIFPALFIPHMHYSFNFLSVWPMSILPDTKSCYSLKSIVPNQSNAPILLWKVMRIICIRGCKSSLKTFCRYERCIACLCHLFKSL